MGGKQLTGLQNLVTGHRLGHHLMTVQSFSVTDSELPGALIGGGQLSCASWRGQVWEVIQCMEIADISHH